MLRVTSQYLTQFTVWDVNAISTRLINIDFINIDFCNTGSLTEINNCGSSVACMYCICACIVACVDIMWGRMMAK